MFNIRSKQTPTFALRKGTDVSSTSMGIDIKALLLLTKSAAMASSSGLTQITTLVNSLTASKKELGSGKIAPPLISTKASTTITEETEKGSIGGATATFITVNSKMILEKVKAK
jgi:hypothetical protein